MTQDSESAADIPAQTSAGAAAASVGEQAVRCEIPGCTRLIAYSGTGRRPKYCGMTIDGLRRRDEIVIEACTAARLPLAISMSGGYASDVDAIVTIHANTIRVAASQCSIGV